MLQKIFLLYALVFCSLASAQKITSIPFEELYGGVIMIKATVDNKTDTLNFIFDTGSGHISLDSAAARFMGIVAQEEERYIKGIGGVKKAKRTKPISLHLPGLQIDSLEFNVNDYAVLQESYGEQIDGIIGFAFINKYLLNVNFDSSVIHVYKRGTVYKQPKKGYLWSYTLPYLPTTQVAFKDAKAQNPPLYIDCGAGLSLLLSEEYLRDSGFIQTKKKPIVAQIEGIAGAAKTRLTTVKELKIGPYKFKNVPTYLYEDNFGLLNYPMQKGLIGNDILRRFNWWLDYGKSSMFLYPNKSFNDPFDYSYTGLSLVFVDGLINVSEVIPNSPADKSGFVSGDIILSIDDVFLNNIKAARVYLQNARAVVKVVVIRDGKPKILLMKIQSIQ